MICDFCSFQFVAIRQFPSKFFYQNLLTDAHQAKNVSLISVPTSNHTALPLLARGMVEDGEIDDNFHDLSPLTFLDLRAGGDINVGRSYRNDAEVQLVMQLLGVLLPHLRHHSIALIAPYKAQVYKLRNALRDAPDLASLQQERRQQDAEIEFGTVDGFQGREKDVVIFSAVRSSRSDGRGHSGRSIGFVADERRLNVAITRAKRLLIVVGNADTLSCDATWSGMIQDLQSRHNVTRVDRLESLRSSDLLQLLAFK